MQFRGVLIRLTELLELWSGKAIHKCHFMEDKGKTTLDNSKEEQGKTLQKKAKKKYLSKGIAYHLYYETDSPLRKSYQNSMYCADVLAPNKTQTKLTTKYCKNRWCPLCSSIRIAMLINGYGPQLKELNEPYFVTLTAPPVPAELLPERIEQFGKAFRQIVHNHRARKMGMKGIRKAECTVRPKGLYHYHYHVIIDGKANAEHLVKRWLEIVPGALPQSQDLRPANEGSFIELFKYFTKLVAKDKRTGMREIVEYKRLDIIFQALRGLRTFQPFGGLKPVSEDIDEEELEANILISADSIFKWIMNDWVNLETGECLTGYEPSQSLKRLIDEEEVFYTKSAKKARIAEAKERKLKGEIKPTLNF